MVVMGQLTKRRKLQQEVANEDELTLPSQDNGDDGDNQKSDKPAVAKLDQYLNRFWTKFATILNVLGGSLEALGGSKAGLGRLWSALVRPGRLALRL